MHVSRGSFEWENCAHTGPLDAQLHAARALPSLIRTHVPPDIVVVPFTQT